RWWGAGGEGRPMGRARTGVRENRWTAPQVRPSTSKRQMPVKVLEDNRRVINDWRASNEENKVSFTHLVAWAILQALKAFPRLNDAYDSAGGVASPIRRQRPNLGLAVDVEEADGLPPPPL